MAINQAIIRIRRGLKEELQIDKLLPGELAMATNAPIMWFCWSPGEVEQIPTNENIGEVIEEITKKYLSEYAKKTDIPTKTSQLQNDSNFLTEHQDLSGYAEKATSLAGYGITDGATKEEFNQLSQEIDDITKDGKNLFYMNKISDKTALSVVNIGELDASDLYYTTDFIEVLPSTNYRFYGFERIITFDGNKNPIERIIATNNVATTSANAKYVRASGQKSVIDRAIINKGNLYIPYEKGAKKIDENALYDMSLSPKKISDGYPVDYLSDIQHGKNLFNKNNVESGILANDGFITTNADHVTSKYILVKPNTTYFIRMGTTAVEYDEELNTIKVLTHGGGSVTTSANTKYMRISVPTNNLDICQLEEGSEFTFYEDFYRTFKYFRASPEDYDEVRSRLASLKKVITTNRANTVYSITNNSDIVVCGVQDYNTNSVFVNKKSDNTLRRCIDQWLASDYSYPNNCNFFYKMLVFKNSIYGVGIDNTDGIWKIWKGQYSSDCIKINWGTNPVFVARNEVVTFSLACGFNCNNDYLFIGEYGFNDDLAPKIYRSSDGLEWEEILTLTNSRHVHAINPDPYVKGSVWMCSGEPEGYIYHSSDNGTTWETVINEFGRQSCQISFDENYVYFADDCGGYQCATVISKKTNTPFMLTNDIVNKFGVYGGNEGDAYYSNAFYGAVTEDGVYYGVIQDESSGGNTGGVFRVLSIGDHASVIKKLDFLPTPNGYKLLAELYETKERVYFNQYFMYKTRVVNLSSI